MDYNKLHKELLAWKAEKIITEEQYKTLEKRYAPKQNQIKKEEVKSLKPLIIFSIIIVILGTLSWIAQKVTGLNDIVVLCSLIFLIIGLLYLGRYFEGRSLKVINFLGKLVIFGSCIITTFVIFYIDVKVGNVFGINLLGSDWSLFILISGLILMFISYKIENKIILGYSLFSFILWFICEGKIYGGQYDSYWLGVTFPIRMFLFSLIFILLGRIHTKENKILKNMKINISNNEFVKTFYIFGILTMFIPVWIASLGGLLTNPLFPIKTEILLFVLFAMVISTYLIYIGIIKSNKVMLNLGLAFLIFEVYGKLYGFIYSRSLNLMFCIIVFVIAFGTAIIVEYILKHEVQIKEELLKGSKG